MGNDGSGAGTEPRGRAGTGAWAVAAPWGRGLRRGFAGLIAAGLLAGCVTAPDGGPNAGTPGGLSALVTTPRLAAAFEVGTNTAAGTTAETAAETAAGTTADTPSEAPAAALARLVESNAAVLAPQTAFARAFYDRRDFRPAWTDTTGWTPRGRQVHAVLATAWADGLADIAAPAAPPTDGRLAPAALARHDAALTAALADYAHAALAQRPAWAPKVANGVLGALEAIAADDPAADRPGRLFRLLGEDDRQARLRHGLLRYAALAAAGGWPTVAADSPTLEPGEPHAEVITLRARLAATGDLAIGTVTATATATAMATATPDGAGPSDAGTPDAPVLDPALVAAVKHFQARHGLAVDGRVGPRTRAALAVPAETRVRQMALNLRRLRALPPDPGGRSIEVNIAGAVLEGREDGVTTFRTDVIVGMRDRPTPELHSAIDRLVLNPTWTVPTSIARKDILPKLRRDPAYLARNNFRVFDGWSRDAAELDPATIDWTADDVNIRTLRLRQAPGPGNALGEIKFMFPNRHGVYLHSTPSRGLFARSTRTFSSGCVRVRDPLDLATFLLDAPETWTPETLKARIAAGGTRTVRPPQSVPLAMIYLTAWVDADGTAQFRRDVYGLDTRALETLARAF
ncbi:L,D-transpeptidase family protein [Roseospira goensis]|uniref:Murein L,D-transpeptidase YcbB/YkuD n=1 Tax=Roseospira goensis TaxID=391922 RepID=A0A7W6RXT0_9PROT|nr:L,D-transpeptidase family protein [Roseospira goensis]MBB4285199.1 murein L,D-transpeptidase YcbB/YkuD [Roseospira goensis]